MNAVFIFVDDIFCMVEKALVRKAQVLFRVYFYPRAGLGRVDF